MNNQEKEVEPQNSQTNASDELGASSIDIVDQIRELLDTKLSSLRIDITDELEIIKRDVANLADQIDETRDFSFSMRAASLTSRTNAQSTLGMTQISDRRAFHHQRRPKINPGFLAED